MFCLLPEKRNYVTKVTYSGDILTEGENFVKNYILSHVYIYNIVVLYVTGIAAQERITPTSKMHFIAIYYNAAKQIFLAMQNVGVLST